MNTHTVINSFEFLIKKKKYTLFDGLAYNTCGYFASCVVIFPSSAGARKNKSKEQNVRSYFMPSNKRLLFPYEKNCYLAIGFYVFGKSIQKYPDSVCENDVNNEKNVRAYYMQTIE